MKWKLELIYMDILIFSDTVEANSKEEANKLIENSIRNRPELLDTYIVCPNEIRSIFKVRTELVK